MKKPCTILPRVGLMCFLMIHSLLAFSQTRTVTGTVKDANGDAPMPGVTVQAKGSQTASQTQADGSFSISVPQAVQTLIFSFVGYEDQEIALGSSNTLNVIMKAGGQSLQDVVVIGYGTARKSDLTGAVGTVKGAQLQERSVASINQALAGRIPGVQVNTNSGRPGVRQMFVSGASAP